jgi:hypothetical protein
LENRKRSAGSTQLRPLPKSAAAAARMAGELGTPCTSGTLSRNHAPHGPGRAESPSATRDSTALL